jgi:peptide/nickel transport system permease protein
MLLIGLTFATFVLYDLTPIDPACVVAGCAPGQFLSTAQRHVIDHILGVDRPVLSQYLDWLNGVVHGDLGTAWQGSTIDPDNGVFGTSVSSEMIPALGRSLSVVVGGLMLLLLLSVPIAGVSATRPGSWFDRATAGLLLIGVCTHPLVIGLLLQALAREWSWLPSGGYCSIRRPELAADTPTPPIAGGCYGFANWAWHLLFPWLTFVIFFAALYVRVLRASLIEVLDEPYIATARAKGASELRVFTRHALRNAIRPILTMTGMEAGMAVAVLVYIEAVFGINGLGQLSVTAFSGDVGYDRPVIAAIVLFLGIGIIGLNLIVDLLYPVVDRRSSPGELRRGVFHAGPA